MPIIISYISEIEKRIQIPCREKFLKLIKYKMNQNLIRSKISFLKEEKIWLHQTLEDLFDKILFSGENWLENQSHQSCDDIKHILDKAATFFTCKAEEIQAFDKQLDLELKPTVPGQAASTQLVQTTAITPSLPAAQKHSEMKEITSSLQTNLDAFSEKLSALEGRISPLDHNFKKLIDKQMSLEDNLSNLSLELLSVKEKQSSDEEVQTAKQLKTSKRLDKLSTKISEMDTEQNIRFDRILADQQEAGSKFKVTSDLTEQRIINLSDNLSELKEEYLTKIESVENQVTLMIDSSYHLESQFMALTQRMQGLDTTVQNLHGTVDDVSSSVTAASVKCETDLEQLKNRFVVLEEPRNEDMNSLASDLKDIKTKYEQVCQIVRNRLLPLVQLRQILNDRAKAERHDQEKRPL
ncbi:unnamed protein product [Lymnaea stagnalis]|uniref:Uncharacterized protein n=1 Tax=Lymnaea stagnalis TaxID=6523 RepID=A0AAV2HYI5_LYMST